MLKQGYTCIEIFIFIKKKKLEQIYKIYKSKFIVNEDENLL